MITSSLKCVLIIFSLHVIPPYCVNLSPYLIPDAEPVGLSINSIILPYQTTLFYRDVVTFQSFLGPDDGLSFLLEKETRVKRTQLHGFIAL